MLTEKENFGAAHDADSTYDVIVIGAGHAGCEAAHASATLGARTLLITMDLNKIAQMSCNPAVGGIAKGQIVREIDALGGMMAQVTDASTLQFRMLNRSKGPAMWSPRAQCDNHKYSRTWRHILENTDNLQMWQDEVVGIETPPSPPERGGVYTQEGSLTREVQEGSDAREVQLGLHTREAQFGLDLKDSQCCTQSEENDPTRVSTSPLSGGFEGGLPDLIIADGGVGQMEVIRQVVEDELGLQIPIAGLAKDNRHRTHELLFGFPPRTVAIPTESPLFKVLTQMQDEVHRFAITFHRKKRSKRQVASELDNISGIGEKTKTLLIKHFGSVKRIKEASRESLQEVLGPVKGEKIYLSLREYEK